jgi:hypothetical protein
MTNKTFLLQVEIESPDYLPVNNTEPHKNWTVYHTSEETDMNRAWDIGSRISLNILADAQYFGNPKGVRFLIDQRVVNQLKIQKMED